MSEVRYTLAPGLEVVDLGDERFLLRSDFKALELSGETAAEFARRVLSDLDRPLTLAEIVERMPGYRPESLDAQVEALVTEGVLVEAHAARSGRSAPFATVCEQLGLSAGEIAERLAGQTVGVFGLEAHGAHVARMLADLGVGNLLLADPYPFEEAHLSLTPVVDPAAVGASRQDALAASLGGNAGVRIETAGDGPLDRDRTVALAAGCTLLIACWDRGFAAGQHWLNQAAVEHGVPALFGDLRSTVGFAGPFFLPLRSACWMCSRMRALACEEDFTLAMAQEEHLDRRRAPGLASRGVLPALPLHLAAVLGLDALHHLARLAQPALVDRILEVDALRSESRHHPVLVQPSCPVCAKKKTPRESPGPVELRNGPRGPNLGAAQLRDRLVSPLTGVVSSFAAAPRDPAEPGRPLVWRARLSNHRFLAERDDSHSSCSGKGVTREEAWMSCLGEAAERYGGSSWSRDELEIEPRAALDGEALAPPELVLYLPNQYPELPYAPYREDTPLAWIRGRALTRDREVWLPAIAVLMDYEVRSPEEFLFPITSNGLAAGPSLCEAVLRALYETLERDAFLIAWLNRLPGRAFEPADHPDPAVRELALAYDRRGVRLRLFELPTDHPVAVFLGVAMGQGTYGGPAAVVGLGADLDPTIAARRAALEVAQVRPSLRRRVRGESAERMAEVAADPMEVSTLDDHALLYAHPSTAGAFDFLAGEAGRWEGSSAPPPPAAALDRLLDHFRSEAQEVLYVDLTPPDLGSLGLHVARVVLPGFQPIWFGRRERRLGGRRLYELPQRLGLRAEPSSPESLNPLPHPLA